VRGFNPENEGSRRAAHRQFDRRGHARDRVTNPLGTSQYGLHGERVCGLGSLAACRGLRFAAMIALVFTTPPQT
jgi:hypothetical protein